MKYGKSQNQEDWIDYDDFRGKKIKRVNSDIRPKRETKNWKKAWDDHSEEFDERDEFYANTNLNR
jgi:hypothetical protein